MYKEQVFMLNMAKFTQITQMLTNHSVQDATEVTKIIYLYLYHITVYSLLVPLVGKVKMVWKKNFHHVYWHSLCSLHSPRFFLLLGTFYTAISTTQVLCYKHFGSNFKDLLHSNLDREIKKETYSGKIQPLRYKTWQAKVTLV